MRARTHSVNRTAPGFDPDKVISQIVELLFDARLSRAADSDHTDYRRNPDRDSQDRQNASHLVSEERHQGRPEKSRVVQRTSLPLRMPSIPTLGTRTMNPAHNSLQREINAP